MPGSTRLLQVRDAAGFAAALCLTFLTSCGSSGLTLPLPTRGVDTPINFGGRERSVFVISPFEDERANPNRCGIRKRALGAEAGDIRCASDPNEWIAQLLKEHLRNAEFSVVETPTGRTLVVHGQLVKLDVEPVLADGSVETDIHVKLIATTESGLRAERNLFVKKSIFGDPRRKGSYNRSIDLGASTMAYEMVNAILHLMDRYPGLF